ncbi:MAG: sigma-54-dependent Fis family transcriptional regulator [Rubrivivax sp.]
MNPQSALQWTRAQALRARGNALPPQGTPSDDVLDSWVRCMHAGLDLAAEPDVQIVEAADLAHRREAAEVVRRLALAELETLAQQIAGSNFLLAFADRDGVILDLLADNRFQMSGTGAGIRAGSIWSEQRCGTNGLGTALHTGRSVAVSGLEHYFLPLGDISCTAAPVRDAQGDIVGVLDASSYFESRQLHTQALVQMAATHIENGLLAHQMRDVMVLAIHPRAEFLATLSTGLLAFDDDGRLRAINGRGRRLLAELDTQPGAAFEQLFGEPWERFLARLQLRDTAPLRDALGSSLVARVVHRPRPVPAAPLPRAVPAVARPRPAASPAPDVVADDPAVAEAFRQVQAAVRLKVPVVILGETGTGKEVLARHAHRSSGRRGEFVAVNCAALPAEVFEAELFGYVGGAFTGARREGSVGLIASADGGTLLLDEIGELPVPLQAALLRFLDEHRVRPLGGTTTRPVDVQLLAATNADLHQAVAERRFRADLLYRLDTVTVTLPPLRARSDLPAAVRFVLAQIDAAARIDDDAVQALAALPWPGNFRELRSVLTRALLAGGGQCVTRALLAPWLSAADAPPAAAGSALQRSVGDLVRKEFQRSGHSVSRTARALGISRTTVYRHLRSQPG